jgi:acyl carrier protein
VRDRAAPGAALHAASAAVQETGTGGDPVDGGGHRVSMAARRRLRWHRRPMRRILPVELGRLPAQCHQRPDRPDLLRGRVHTRKRAAMQDPRIDTILDIIAESAKIDRSRLRLETPLDELNISSLTLIEAVFEIESRYDVEIPTEELVKRPESTLGELIEGVLARIDVKTPVAAWQPTE